MKPWPYRNFESKSPRRMVEGQVDEAFGYDAKDPANSDHYNPSAVVYEKAEDVYFMFPSSFLHIDPSDDMIGPVDIQMAVSRDGVRYERLDRRPYVRLGRKGLLDSASAYMGVGMIVTDDEVFQYYVGYQRPHGEHERHGVAHMDRWGAIIRTVQRLDGFVSADAAYGGGSLTTPPLVFSGSRLELNIDTSALGTARVAIEDGKGRPIPGFEIEDCDVINVNFTHKTVTGRARATLAH